MKVQRILLAIVNSFIAACFCVGSQANELKDNCDEADIMVKKKELPLLAAGVVLPVMLERTSSASGLTNGWPGTCEGDPVLFRTCEDLHDSNGVVLLHAGAFIKAVILNPRVPIGVINLPMGACLGANPFFPDPNGLVFDIKSLSQDGVNYFPLNAHPVIKHGQVNIRRAGNVIALSASHIRRKTPENPKKLLVALKPTKKFDRIRILEHDQLDLEIGP